MKMERVPFSEMKAVIKTAFTLAGMDPEKARICARVHAESSRDGVYTHGLNRVERFIEYIQKSWVKVNAVPTLDIALDNMEIYNGNLGPGILNGLFAMNRATEMATGKGLAMVGMNNTTHWMRGGTYGWLAAEKGYIALCWTNTQSVMPAWGAKSCSLGNNPFVMAIPRKKGPIVLDMAISQYSNGRIEATRLANKNLPYPGGFDVEGELTDQPDLIQQSGRTLPIGYWKGSGFAFLLDIFAAILSKGLTVSEIDRANKGSCGGCSQVFLAVNPYKIDTGENIGRTISEAIHHLKHSQPESEESEIYYPGERSLKTRIENMELGIPVDSTIWSRVKRLAGLN